MVGVDVTEITPEPLFRCRLWSLYNKICIYHMEVTINVVMYRREWEIYLLYYAIIVKFIFSKGFI